MFIALSQSLDRSLLGNFRGREVLDTPKLRAPAATATSNNMTGQRPPSRPDAVLTCRVAMLLYYHPTNPMPPRESTVSRKVPSFRVGLLYDDRIHRSGPVEPFSPGRLHGLAFCSSVRSKEKDNKSTRTASKATNVPPKIREILKLSSSTRRPVATSSRVAIPESNVSRFIAANTSTEVLPAYPNLRAN